MSTRKEPTPRASAAPAGRQPVARLGDAVGRVGEGLGQVNLRAKAMLDEVGRRVEPLARRWPDLPQRGLKDAERALDLGFDLAAQALEHQRALAKRLLAEAEAATERLSRR